MEPSEARPEREADWTGTILDVLREEVVGAPDARRREAEGRLVEEYRSTLIARARSKRVEGLDDADLVDEALASALGRARAGVLRRFRRVGPGALYAWLVTVLDRTAIDRRREASTVRRGAGAAAVSLESAPDIDAPSSAPSPTSEARHHELVELCRGVLPEREWRAWLGVEIHERPAEEVGETLGCTAAAVRGLVHRARHRLHEALHREVDAP